MSEKPSAVPLKEKLAAGFLKATAALPLSVSRALGAVIGWVSWRTSSTQAKVTEENLRLCFPALSAQELRALTRASLMETAKTAMETGAIWLRDHTWTEQYFLRVHQREVLDDALASGTGVIVLGPHLGNWEALGFYLSKAAPITFLYQPPDMASLEPIIIAGRTKLGGELAPTNRKGVATLMKSLKAGRVVGILPDQVPDASGGEFAPFFGVPALTMTLVHSLQQRTHCRIIASFAQRVPGGFEIHFIEADPDAYSEETAVALAGLNKTVENCVNVIPAQYQWEYKRFRKQPEGYPRRYRYK